MAPEYTYNHHAVGWFNEEQLTQDPILKFLEPNPRLPEAMYDIASLFASLASDILDKCPRSPERTVAFRKLLEAKDCAVRSML